MPGFASCCADTYTGAGLSWQSGIAVGLNGQSGAEWAGRSVAWYDVSPGDVTMRLEYAGTSQKR